MPGVCADIRDVAANDTWLWKEDAQVYKVSAGREREGERER